MDICVFCKIRDGEIPAKVEFRDEKCLAIWDIKPKSKVHLLLIPNKHIATIADIEDSDQELMGYLMIVARDLGKKLGLEGYRLQYNVGKSAGQEVFHIHLHLLG